ncbi:integrase [Paracoccus hibiscisoli]|uniref:Integrase n=1 Tax=Paracoccus hibiscisoli TaxID=2023261 RepID=A0A4U0QVS8_9RHOB|nr:integrase [Paracoccus hibiscisoli]
MRTPTIILRENTWHIRKRVPVRYSAVEPRTIVHISLHTDSRALAQSKAGDVWREMLEAWEAKLVGQDKAAEDRMAAARNLAQRRGYRYLSAPDVAQLPVADLLTRLESTVDGAGRFDPREADAALGLASPPVLTVEQALDAFYDVAIEDLRGKNDDQIRRWKNPRIKATRNFIEVVGNKALAEVTTDDMYAFRKWWVDRVMEGETRADTANKDFTHLIGSWKRVCRAKGIQLGFSTEGLMLRTDTDKDDVRPPFSRSWIRDKLLAPGALNGLNLDARLILLGMVNTGYRPSEGAGLMPGEIRLSDPVPHILIQRNENRTLKTSHSKRAIPLVGVSLDAFRQAPGGFPRYAKNSAGLSATVNKFLRENGLLETPAHSLYSLRHAFEDRMLTAGIDERVRRDMLGHSLNRERYGSGGDLAFLRDQVAKAAI